MLSERNEKDAIRKALTEADEKNEELLMKVEDANEKIEHLQTMINKCVASLVLSRDFIHIVHVPNPWMHAHSWAKADAVAIH